VSTILFRYRKGLTLINYIYALSVLGEFAIPHNKRKRSHTGPTIMRDVVVCMNKDLRFFYETVSSLEKQYSEYDGVVMRRRLSFCCKHQP
jgi:hypothetical protein